MNNPNDIERFTLAQDMLCEGYGTALEEIRHGRKYSHWIWYIFPQLRGLGHSHNAEFYGISGREEAERYLAHPVLGPRLREITRTLVSHKGKAPEAILGKIDALKVRSCMTLFNAIAPGELFAEVLDAFYSSRGCERTLEMLGEQPPSDPDRPEPVPAPPRFQPRAAARLLSVLCILAHAFVCILAWGIWCADVYLRHSAPPFEPRMDLHVAGWLLLCFIFPGSGLCGFLYMCTMDSENREKRALLWGALQLAGSVSLGIVCPHFLNWGHGAAATLLFYGSPVIALLSFGAAFLLSTRCSPIHPEPAFSLRLFCLLFLIAGAVLTGCSVSLID